MTHYYLLGIRDHESGFSGSMEGQVLHLPAGEQGIQVCLMQRPVTLGEIPGMAMAFGRDLRVSVVLICARPPHPNEVLAIALCDDPMSAPWIVGAVDLASGRAAMKPGVTSPAHEEWN